jgi:hypothetical protein
MPAGLVETINERSAAVVARGSVDEQAKALRDQLGPATYDRLVADAKNSRPDLGGAVGDAHALRLLASQGKYLAAYRGGKKS